MDRIGKGPATHVPVGPRPMGAWAQSDSHVKTYKILRSSHMFNGWTTCPYKNYKPKSYDTEISADGDFWGCTPYFNVPRAPGSKGPRVQGPPNGSKGILWEGPRSPRGPHGDPIGSNLGIPGFPYGIPSFPPGIPGFPQGSLG